MAIMIKEYLGHDGFEVKWDYNKNNILDVKESNTSMQLLPGTLNVEHEALHVGPTRNFTWYTDEALEGSVPTWTYPYPRPVIKHHNEENGDTLGRVFEANYHKKSQLSNTGYLEIIANIPDEKGIKEVESGLLKTVSIGAIVHEARCSICDHNLAKEGQCEHERGEVYDGKICYWMIYKMEAKEISYVNVPSDKYAQVTKHYRNTKRDMSIKESFIDEKGVSKVNDTTIIEENQKDNSVNKVTESVVVVEEGQVEGTSAQPEEPEAKEPEIKPEEKQVEMVSKEEFDKLAEQVKELQVKLTEAQAEVKAKNSQLQKVEETKEALENKLISFQEAEKEDVVKQVLAAREQLGLSADVEKLQTKSINFLKESLTDLQEELTFVKNKTPEVKESAVEIPTQVESPAVVENVDAPKKEKASSIDVAEKMTNDLINMMSRAMDGKKY